jgi:hypothetical protein
VNSNRFVPSPSLQLRQKKKANIKLKKPTCKYFDWLINMWKHLHGLADVHAGKGSPCCPGKLFIIVGMISYSRTWWWMHIWMATTSCVSSSPFYPPCWCTSHTCSCCHGAWSRSLNSMALHRPVQLMYPKSEINMKCRKKERIVVVVWIKVKYGLLLL